MLFDIYHIQGFKQFHKILSFKILSETVLLAKSVLLEYAAS